MITFSASYKKHANIAQSGHAETKHAGLLLTFCCNNFKTFSNIFFPLFSRNAFCLELAPVPERAPAQHTTHSPARRASRCEREREGWARDTETDRERKRTWEGNSRRYREYRRRRCGTSHQSLALMKDISLKKQMCFMLRHWSHYVLVIHSGHPDHEPTTSRLPVRNGARHSRWNKTLHMAKHHLREFPSKKSKQINITRNPSAEKKIGGCGTFLENKIQEKGRNGAKVQSGAKINAPKWEKATKKQLVARFCRAVVLLVGGRGLKSS